MDAGYDAVEVNVFDRPGPPAAVAPLLRQASAIDVILAHADHVHTRVGFSEGPQVSDPRNPMHRHWLGRCMASSPCR